MSKKDKPRRREQRRRTRDRAIPPVESPKAYRTSGEPMIVGARGKRKVARRDFENVSAGSVEVTVERCGFTRDDGRRCWKILGDVIQLMRHDRVTGKPEGWQVVWYPKGLPGSVTFFASWDGGHGYRTDALEGFCVDHRTRYGDPRDALDVVAKRTTGGDPASFWMADGPPSRPHQRLLWRPTTQAGPA